MFDQTAGANLSAAITLHQTKLSHRRPSAITEFSQFSQHWSGFFTMQPPVAQLRDIVARTGYTVWTLLRM